MLAINLWDKFEETKRWIDEARRWLPAWNIRVDCNGTTLKQFDVETRLFPNRGGVLGTYDSYRFEVPPDCDIIASVHAKCWISDPSVIDRIADQMTDQGADAAIITSPHFHYGMNLHLFLMRANRWQCFTKHLSEDVSSWPEEVVRIAIDKTCKNILEIPNGKWQYLPDNSPVNFNDEGGRIVNGYQISCLNGEDQNRLISTEMVNHPARRRKVA